MLGDDSTVKASGADTGMAFALIETLIPPQSGPPPHLGTRRAVAVRCDVTRAEDVKTALDKAVEACRRLDFVFKNAGIEPPIMATADLTEDEWDRIVAVNLRGIFLCMKWEIPILLKHGGGTIINTSSRSGPTVQKPGRVRRCQAQRIGLTNCEAF
jgi:NAD(P)-dependent dehydrogenase (short-subunit alcohol dehydrogenase family)